MSAAAATPTPTPTPVANPARVGEICGLDLTGRTTYEALAKPALAEAVLRVRAAHTCERIVEMWWGLQLVWTAGEKVGGGWLMGVAAAVME